MRSEKSAIPLRTPDPAPGVQPPPALDGGRRDITLSDIFGAIRRRRWTVALVTAIAVALALAFVTTATRLYRADIVLVLETREKSVVSLDSVVSGLSGDASVVNTELAVLRSRNLLAQVVRDLDLTSDPEFAPDLREDRGWTEYLSPGALFALVKEALGLGPTGPERKPDPVVEAVEILQGKLNVIVQPNSLVFVIQVETESPEKSAAIANRIGEFYIRDQQQIKYDETARATAWLSEQVLQLKDELEAAEARVEEYSLSSNLVSEEALGAMSRQIKDLRERLSDLRIQRDAEAAPLEAINALRLDPSSTRAAEQVPSGEVRRLAAEIDALPDTVSASDPGRAALEARMSAALDRVEAPVLDALARFDGQIAALERSVAAQTAEIDRQSADLVTLRQLTREAEASRLIYEYFLTRMKETSVQQGIAEADARVVSNAIVPIRPFFPRSGLTLMLALVGGLVLGAGIAVLRWQLDTRFRSPEELEEFTGVTVFGAIPLANSRRRNKILNYLVERPSSSLAESVRDFRTSLLMANPDRPPQMVLISSASPGDGKTTTAALLAHINAMLGRRVLLIECDLRRPTFSQLFQIKPETGIADLLRGEKTLEEVVYRDEGAGLDVIFAQETGLNPSDVFSSRRFAEFLQEMRQRYDFIVIDSPPVLAVPDARIIARHTDALVVCAAWRKVTKPMIRAVMRQFANSRTSLSGFVMTKFDPARASREGYGEYSTYYGASKAYHRN